MSDRSLSSEFELVAVCSIVCQFDFRSNSSFAVDGASAKIPRDKYKVTFRIDLEVCAEKKKSKKSWGVSLDTMDYI